LSIIRLRDMTYVMTKAFYERTEMRTEATLRRTIVAILAFITMLFMTTQALAVIDVEGRYWFTNLDTTIEASSGTVIGTNLDLVNDLGLDDLENFVEGRITLELGHHSFRYAYMPLSWSGLARITKDINFAGRTYPASSEVSSDVQIDYHRFSYRYDFINKLKNRLGIIAEVKYFDGRVNLKDAAFGLDESTRLQIPIPAIGVGAQVAIPLLAKVGAEITGMTLGSLAYVLDAEANVGFHPLPYVDVSAGYRFLKFHIDKDDDVGSVTLKGPFITLSANF